MEMPFGFSFTPMIDSLWTSKLDPAVERVSERDLAELLPRVLDSGFMLHISTPRNGLELFSIVVVVIDG